MLFPLSNFESISRFHRIDSPSFGYRIVSSDLWHFLRENLNTHRNKEEIKNRKKKRRDPKNKLTLYQRMIQDSMYRVDKDWTKNWKKGIAFRVNSPRLKVNIRLAIWRMTMKIIKSLTDCDKRFWTRLKKKKISVSLFNFSIPTNVKETYLNGWSLSIWKFYYVLLFVVTFHIY